MSRRASGEVDHALGPAAGLVCRANRPNTWLHRPACKCEEKPCQLGAVHTWHKADKSRRMPICPLSGASSTGRRNTGVKFLCRGFKSQGLAWPLIELAGHFVEMGLRVHRQVGSFRKILSQQAIGVLVGTALPWTLRIAKVNIDVGR